MKFITALRFPLAVLVVFIHSYNSVWMETEVETGPLLTHYLSKILPSFAVPMFFAISGFLFFKNLSSLTWETYRQKLHRRLYTLLIPYLIWNMIAFTLYYIKDYMAGQMGSTCFSAQIFWGYRTLSDNGVNFLTEDILPTTAPILMPLWFVRDLILTTLLSPFIGWLLGKTKIIGLFLLGFVYYSHIWPNIGGVSFTAFWFFSLGAYFSIHRIHILESTQHISKPCMIAVVPLSVMLWLYPAYENILQELYVLAAMTTALHIAHWYTQKREIYKILSQSSFFIYAAHCIVLLPVTDFLAHWSAPYGQTVRLFAYSCCIIVTILVCLAGYAILRYGLPQWSWPLTGIRYNKQH